MGEQQEDFSIQRVDRFTLDYQSPDCHLRYFFASRPGRAILDATPLDVLRDGPVDRPMLLSRLVTFLSESYDQIQIDYSPPVEAVPPQQRDYNAVVRLHSEVPSLSHARKLARKARKYFRSLGPCRIDSVEQYWKIEEQFVIVLRINVRHLTRTTMRKVKQRAGGHISELGDDFVWTPKDGSVWVDPAIVWGCFDIVSEEDL